MKSPSTYLIAMLLLLSSCGVPLKKKHILVIGDSNGEAAKGWVFQFQQLRKGGPLVNTSIGGNTVGFNGMNTPERNTLNQLSVYLRKGYAEMGQIDEIIIALGTNDCKAEYRNNETARHIYFRELLTDIEGFFSNRGQDVPRIVLVSPPPIGNNSTVSAEFQGADNCIAELTDFISDLAVKNGLCFVNLLQNPGASLLEYSADGVHFDAIGYEKIAREIVGACY